jgi:ribonuclease P/MRP protein subunit RPP1
MTAADCGYNGLVLVNPQDAGPQFDASAIRERYGIDIVRGSELTPETPEAAAGAIGHHRPESTVLALQGGTDALNEYAVRQDKLDVLARPMAGDADLDHALVKAAAKHGVRLAVDLGPVLRGAGDPRSSAISDRRKLWELISAYDAPYVVTARPSSHLELRSPRELAAVGRLAGLDQTAAETGLAEWRRLTDRNRDRLADGYVAPGVRRNGEAPDE